MIRRKLPLRPAPQIPDLAAGTSQFVAGGEASAVFCVPCVGGQEPFAADAAFLRRVTHAQTLKEIGAEHPHKGNVVDALHQLCLVLAGMQDRQVLGGFVSERHPRACFVQAELRREAPPEQFCQTVRGAVTALCVQHKGKPLHALFVFRQRESKMSQHRHDAPQQHPQPDCFQLLRRKRTGQFCAAVCLQTLRRERFGDAGKVEVHVQPVKGRHVPEQRQDFLRRFPCIRQQGGIGRLLIHGFQKQVHTRA